MSRKICRLIFTTTLFGLFGLSSSSSYVFAGVKDTGEKGAQIYCYMRNSGNEHEVSWNAAYEVIKRQAHSLFKTSPKHGAVMIIEAVVNDPEEYQACGNYLGDLFGGSNLKEDDLKDNKIQESKIQNRYSY
tara:strand:+ start:96 stop:488 length:393 start_codon:yes stop_codon:yes gene_type:complete